MTIPSSKGDKASISCTEFLVGVVYKWLTVQLFLAHRAQDAIQIVARAALSFYNNHMVSKIRNENSIFYFL